MTEQQNAIQYEFHEMALRFPVQRPEEKADLKRNMIQRVHQGLDPLEFPILLIEGKIADGRHRYQIWRELAADGECDGYFSKNNPPVEEIGQDDEAAALLRINSRNLCHRNLSAEQKAAIFLIQEEKNPSIKQLVEKIRYKNKQRMKAGRALKDNNPGTNTNETLGELAGNVSASTIKTVKAVQKYAPQHLADVASGKMSAKTAMNNSIESQQTKFSLPNSALPKRPSRKSPIDLGAKKNVDLIALTLIDVGDAGQLAQVREFLEDESIAYNKDGRNAFSFDGTVSNQKTTLAFLANLIGASGPFRLTIRLDAILPQYDSGRLDQQNGLQVS